MTAELSMPRKMTRRNKRSCWRRPRLKKEMNKLLLPLTLLLLLLPLALLLRKTERILNAKEGRVEDNLFVTKNRVMVSHTRPCRI